MIKQIIKIIIGIIELLLPTLIVILESMKIKNLWPFRNFANFTLSAITATGAGLLYYSVTTERVFSNSPVVN